MSITNTSAIAGYAGTVTGLTSQTLAAPSEIKEWSMNVSMETLDATSFVSGGWRQFVPGLQGATGTLQAVGVLPFENGANVSVAFKTSASAGFTMTCTCILHGCVTNVPVDGLITYSADFTVTGAVVIASI